MSWICTRAVQVKAHMFSIYYVHDVLSRLITSLPSFCRFVRWVCLHLRPPSGHGHADEDHCQERADRLSAGQNPTFRGDYGEAAPGEKLNVMFV